MKKILPFVLLACACAAQAQGTATATTGSTAGSTAETSISNVGSPTFITNQAQPLAETTTVVRQKGLPVASAGPTYVNGPANDTCIEAGTGFALQAQPIGFNVNKSGTMQVACDVRSRAVNAKVTGQDQTIVSMIQCQDPNTAAAFEDAADLMDSLPQVGDKLRPLAFRCPDRLRPDWAKNRQGATFSMDGSAASQQPRRVATTDPFIAGSGRAYPSPR